MRPAARVLVVGAGGVGWRNPTDAEKTYEGLHGMQHRTACIACNRTEELVIAADVKNELIADDEYGTPVALCASCAHAAAAVRDVGSGGVR